MAEINLSLLPAPNVIEVLSFEDILAQMKAAAIALMPELEPVLALESEPATKVLQVGAAFVLLTRARVNDAAKSVMLAYATGGDLDQLAALYGVQRLVITPANPLANPPVVEALETDDALRARVQLAPEAFSTAGPIQGYEFHARSASGQVRDVAVSSPSPGMVQVVVQSATGSGVPSAALLNTVFEALSDETVRPLCDNVVVVGVDVVTYQVIASIEVMSGPDPSVVLQNAQAALAKYTSDQHRIGRAVRLSGIYAALHQTGVTQVNLTSPLADIEPTKVQTARCTAMTVTLAT
ncbi:MAG: baseplate assembly protein [Desulfurellales bacterium]|nr:MAG: baseplate assembly protein [Desulfurellales bacterium]